MATRGTRRSKRLAKKSANSQSQSCENEWESESIGQQLALSKKAPDSEPTSDGEDCELHFYESRLDTRGEATVLRAGTRSTITPPKTRSHRACLLLTRYYDFDGTLYGTEVTVQSRHLVSAIRKVLGDPRDITFDEEVAKFTEPPRFLYHYQAQLREYSNASGNSVLQAHTELLLSYVQKALYRESEVFKSIDFENSLSPRLEHRHLWAIFRPRCLLYQKHEGVDVILRLRYICESEPRYGNSTKIKAWTVGVERIDYCGNDVRYVKDSVDVPHFDGRKPVHELEIFPVQFHPGKKKIQEDLLVRGRKFLSLCDIQHYSYDGMAQMIDVEDKIYRKEKKIRKKNIQGRIVVDIEGLSLKEPDFARRYTSDETVYKSGREALSSLSDEEVMTCHYEVGGYSLDLKLWGFFSVDKAAQVSYNANAFDALVLGKTQKELISSLVRQRDEPNGDFFDDLIRGKGKGLIFLLHGPPGVGKTYTAESIADHTRRPLLKINSTELHDSRTSIEEALTHIFWLASRWKSVTLIDEADVFMQERRVDSWYINNLVSTLLRVLEYHEGIMFLTTNRLQTIDPAFKSRIHLAIAYPPLSNVSRRELWTASIVRSNADRAPEWLNERFLQILARKKVNGREIRNIVRMGHSLAQSAKRDLCRDDLMHGLEALEQFEIDFKKRPGEQERSFESLRFWTFAWAVNARLRSWLESRRLVAAI